MILTLVMLEEEKHCIYCDHKFIVEEGDPEYRCPDCLANKVTSFINTKW